MKRLRFRIRKGTGLNKHGQAVDDRVAAPAARAVDRIGVQHQARMAGRANQQIEMGGEQGRHTSSLDHGVP